MAKLKGILKIEGTLQDMTFYKTQDGHLVKTKSGVSAERIANDPAFARTRENGTEFSNAASAGKVLRDSVRNMVNTAADNRVTSRLTQVMARIKNLDTTSARGERTVAIGSPPTPPLFFIFQLLCVFIYFRVIMVVITEQNFYFSCKLHNVDP